MGDGTVSLKHENGSAWEKGVKKAGKRHGTWTTWWDSGGVKIELVLDMESGPGTVWYEDGVKWAKGTLKDSNWHGAWLEYHPAGKLKDKGVYKDGRRHGTWEKFSTAGEKTYTGCWLNGYVILLDACSAEMLEAVDVGAAPGG
jgi:antitoxin component YwqK of YwqJK toxin-antitoxin module